MQEITGFTNEDKQRFDLVLSDDSNLSVTLEYRINQGGWFYSLSSSQLTVDNVLLTTSPNILRQWMNKIDFGIAIHTLDLLDPAFLEDFSTGRVRMFLLDQTDLDTIEGLVYE